jgi:hypothetical protein
VRGSDLRVKNETFYPYQENAMTRNVLFSFLAAALAVAVQSSQAHAYGGYHVGYTHVGPSGVTHVGRTAVAGPGGAAVGGSAYHAGGGYAAGGAAYHGAAYGGAAYHGAAVGGYHYSPSYSGSVYAGGYRAGYVGVR